MIVKYDCFVNEKNHLWSPVVTWTSLKVRSCEGRLTSIFGLQWPARAKPILKFKKKSNFLSFYENTSMLWHVCLCVRERECVCEWINARVHLMRVGVKERKRAREREREIEKESVRERVWEREWEKEWENESKWERKRSACVCVCERERYINIKDDSKTLKKGLKSETNTTKEK